MRDIFGNRIETDILGRKLPKKQLQRETIEDNRREGKRAEEATVLDYSLRGYAMERTGRGHDYKATRHDILSGKVTDTKYVEVKSSRTAPLSELQQKTKKKLGSKYVVERRGSFW